MSTEIEFEPKIEFQISIHTGYVYTLCFSPDQTTLCSAGSDLRVILTDLETYKTQKMFTGHERNIWGSDFSSNGKHLVTASADSTCRIWNVESEDGNCAKLEGHQNAVYSARFFPDDPTKVISGSDDKTIKIWDIEKSKEISTITGCEGGVLSVDLLPDHQMIASGDRNHKMRVWDARTGKGVRTLNHENTVRSVRFHGNTFSLASGSYDHRVKVFEYRTFQLLQNYKEHSDYVYSVCFHPSGKYLLSGSHDTTINIIDLLNGKVIHTLNDHSYTVRSVQFSPDGIFFASGSGDKKVLIWNFGGVWNPNISISYSVSQLTSTVKELERKLHGVTEKMKLMGIDHESKINDLEKKLKNNERKMIEHEKVINFLKEKNQFMFDDYYRTKYDIVHISISPLQKMIQNDENQNTFFLNDSFRFLVDFEVTSGPITNSSIDFTSLKISLNDVQVLTSSDVQVVSPKSVSFDFKFTRLGENEIRIEFENVSKVLPFLVQDPTLSVSKSELLLLRGGRGEEVELSNSQPAEKFESGELIQVCLSLVNEQGTPLRFEMVKDFEFSCRLLKKGETRPLKGKFLSRKSEITVSKEEDLVKIGNLVFFVVCTIGGDEKLESGEYVIGIAEFDFSKKKKFLIL